MMANRYDFESWRNAIKRQFIALAFLVAFAPAIAFADCANPSGTAGIITYNIDFQTMQFCDGTTWWDMKGAGGALALLSDVDDALAPSDGQVLTYNNAGGQWTAGIVARFGKDDSLIDNKGGIIVASGTGVGGARAYWIGASATPTTHNNNMFAIADVSSGTNLLTILGGHAGAQAGYVGIGNVTDPTHVLHINGQGRATNSAWATSSDRRVKTNIEPLADGLATIVRLRPVSFEYIDAYRQGKTGMDGRMRGFIAQEVEAVIPDMVRIVDERFAGQEIADFRLLTNSDFVPILVKAVQELKTDNDNLRAEFEAYRAAHP